MALVVREFYPDLKSFKHDNPDLRKAIKMAQRALNRLIDDTAGLETSSHKKSIELLGLVVNICYQS